MPKVIKKNQSSQRKQLRQQGPITIGLDLGDKASRFCVLDEDGNIVLEDKVATNSRAMAKKLAGLGPCRIALEVGTHSPWVSRLLSGLGHEVIVANSRQIPLITASSRKDDRLDAQTLARLARVDPKLLQPIRHRTEKAQQDLMVIRVRAALVDARTDLVNAARGLTKSMGHRLPACAAERMGLEKLEELQEQLQERLKPLAEQAASLTAHIKTLDEQIEQIARKDYPETELLTQIKGVGTLIALTFVLTVDDAERFQHSRDVGCYLGLRPKRSQSGDSEPQQLLVQGAHYILSRLGPDTDLKRWGLKLAARGGKNAKKRACVAVARKLSILLHHLWVTGEVYEPLRNSQASLAA
jgi:transposase